MSINDDKQEEEEAKQFKGFEYEYLLRKEQIVNFPLEIGVTGYAFRKDAICFVNDLASK